MPNYRDYGAIRGAAAPQIAINEKKHTQVYLATHDGDGDYLPYMNRSFMSFSYGGKNIEDFNLIASIENNSLNRQGYASFSDNVTTSDIYDGQLYWSSHFQNYGINFILATDGITEEQLQAFKKWFQPGQIKELILTEHPNRAILARVSAVPVLNLLPFEEPIEITIAQQIYKSSTTLYKGTITLSLIADEPFWYSKVNILDTQVNGAYNTGYWIDANNQASLILNDRDALKIITEDRIPISSMLSNNNNISVLFGNESVLKIDLSYEPTGPRIGYAKIGHAIIPYVLINAGTGINLGTSIFNNDTSTVIDPGYFFYAGTASCKPVLMFTLTPQLSSSGYITSPRNDIGIADGRQYNTIVIESTTKTEFKFTTPSIYTAYNQVIYILSNTESNTAWEDIYKLLRDNVKHYAPRAFAIEILDSLKGSTTKATTELLSEAIVQMRTFLYDNNNVIAPAIFTFDSSTGQATAMITYHETLSTITTKLEQNVGDMVLSDYLIIKDRNNFTNDGYVHYWTAEHPEYSHRIYADVAGGLSNVNLHYRYLYL